MKIYLNPVAAFSRPIVLFIKGNNVDAELVNVDVFGGACQSEDFIKMNPNKQIPVLEDDGFWLTECAAILRYLANKTDSPTYPKDLRHRAKVDELITGSIRVFPGTSSITLSTRRSCPMRGAHPKKPTRPRSPGAGRRLETG